MRILELPDLIERAVDSYGSRGFGVGKLGRGLSVTVATVSAGGEIGAHPAVGPQAFTLIQGQARVESGSVSHELAAGEVAVWAAGEKHRTVAHTDLVALILEGHELERLIEVS